MERAALRDRSIQIPSSQTDKFAAGLDRAALQQHSSDDLLGISGDQAVATNPIDDTHVEIRCSQCGHQNNQPIAWIPNHCELTCSECGAVIAVDRGAFRKAIEDVRQRLNEARSRITRQ
jgi:ribosomal protein S27E